MPVLTDRACRPADPGVLRDRCILSNGRYGVLLAGDGTGFSWFERWALTPWNGGPLESGAGVHVYLRDSEMEGFISLGCRPGAAGSSRGEFRREPGRAVITRWVGDIELVIETCVPPETGANQGLELRRLRLRNHSGRARAMEITTYGEVVLHEPLSHAPHPAFSRLFVRSEFVPKQQALLFRRRVRDSGDAFPWMIHALLSADAVEHETDRVRFLGRGRDVSAPGALLARALLAGTTGDVLDPVFSLRTRVMLGPGGLGERTFLSGVAGGREAALALTDLGSADAVAAVEDLFGAAARAEERRWRDLGIDAARAFELERLAAAVLCGDPKVRPDATVLRRVRDREQVPERPGLKPRRVYAMSAVHTTPPAARVADTSPGISPHTSLDASSGISGQPRTDDQPPVHLLLDEPLLTARFWRALNLPIDVVVLGPDGGFQRL
jgi:cyclic beta-1,2-glucan synthetase